MRESNTNQRKIEIKVESRAAVMDEISLKPTKNSTGIMKEVDEGRKTNLYVTWSLVSQTPRHP